MSGEVRRRWADRWLGVARFVDRRKWLVVVVVAFVILGQLAFLYGLAPGRLASTFTGLQPDSVQYVCYGLQFSGLAPHYVDSLSSTLFERFGYLDVSCPSEGTLIWTVYPRVLLPVLIAGAAQLKISILLVAPSAVIFMAIAGTWLFIALRGWRNSSALSWLFVLGPLLAFSLVLWPAAVLTEGPILLACLWGAVVLRRASLPRNRLVALWVLPLGVLMILTRQSWPIAGAFWAVGALLLWDRRTESTPRTFVSWLRRAALVVAGFAAALVVEALWTPMLVPAGLAAKQGYYQDRGELLGLWNIAKNSVMSSGMDLGSAASRLDVVSVVVVVAAMAALVSLLLRRRWLSVTLLLPLWATGFYSTGLVAVDNGDLGTHFRYYIPAVFVSLAVFWLESASWRDGAQVTGDSAAAKQAKPLRRESSELRQVP